MSERLTFSAIQESRIPTALNVCPDDERMYQWFNSAESLCLSQGRWWGSVVEAQFCVRNFCLVWPREVANVEQIQVCGHNVDTQGAWYNFTRILSGTSRGNGAFMSNAINATGRNQFGQCAGGWPQNMMKDGTAASFATTIGANKVIRTYPTNASDVGKKIVYQGRDKNGIWVRTVYGGSMQNGEQVTLALPFVDTTTVWGPGAPVAVQKDVTVQRVLVYEYDTVAATERALADYQPGETRPSYRVSHIQQAQANRGGCCGTSTTTEETERITTITALVSLQHVQIRSPGDWLILQNLDAYESAMMAVKAKEEKDYAGFMFNFYGTQAGARNARGVDRVVNRGGAIPLLQAELRKNTGDRTAAYWYIDETERYARTMLGFR